MASSMRGKRVVITGCATGMGAAVTRRLLDDGAEVHGLDIREPGVKLASFHVTDLRDPDAIDAAVAAIGGPVDSLIYCAGLPQTFPAIEVLKVNFIAVRHMINAIEPLMHEGSSIVVISSTGGFQWQRNLEKLEPLLATPDFAAAVAWGEADAERLGNGYIVSKEAVNLWVQRRAAELIGKGIRLNATCPAPTETPMMKAFDEAAGANMVDIFVEPIRRRSTPDEQAAPVIFLASDDASFINGHLLNVDGGFCGAIASGALSMADLVADARAKVAS